MAAKISSFSDFGDNYRYLSYKYGIGIHVWHLSLCKLYTCFDLYLLNYHNTIANEVFIRDLCLLRENNIVVDGQDLTSTELTYMLTARARARAVHTCFTEFNNIDNLDKLAVEDYMQKLLGILQ